MPTVVDVPDRSARAYVNAMLTIARLGKGLASGMIDKYFRR